MRQTHFFFFRILSGVAGLLTLAAQAEVRLPALFSDHMVLQQGVALPVWGWADDGEQITVSLGNQKKTTVAAGGKWKVKLASMKAGGPFTLTVTGNNTRTVKDVLIGEVWLASGQSNMEWPLNRSFEPAADIAASQNPNIRLFTVPKLKSNAPVADVQASWQECTPFTVSNFSAVAYYFARDLQQALGVPVGIIHTSWGGSPCEVWISESVLAADPEFRRSFLETWPAVQQKHEQSLAQWEKERAAAQQAGRTFEKRRPALGWKPAELYNGMIAPVIPYAVQGAIWYQGESNAGRAHQYRTLFPTMIRNWRKDWDRDFTFLAVQLAPWDKNKKRSLEEITAAPQESDWAELREAQVHATRVLPKVGLAVITDVGDKDDIHPVKKQPVGARLALLARRIAYDQKVAASGPVFRKMKVKDGQAVISFTEVAGGLEARGKNLKGFAIAGADRKFVWADAMIKGNEVVVSSPQVTAPAAVRYGWADYPVANLFNKAGLPASPFRTDDFPLTTAPKDTLPK